MAVIKKDAIVFASGKQLDIPGGILTITRTLELADYYSRNILFSQNNPGSDKKAPVVVNIYNLSTEELIEVADCMIKLWIELKDNARFLGINDPEIFKIRKSEK